MKGNQGNDVKDLYDVTGLDTTAGVTGFTFDGAMNSNADWTKVTGTVEITPTYTIETTDDTVDVLDGTGAMVNSSPIEIAGTKIAKGDGSAITGASAIATRLQGTGGTQFQFDVSSVNLTGLEVTKIVIDDTEYNFTKTTNTVASAANASDGKLYVIKNFSASTVRKIQFFYGDGNVDQYVVTWTIS